MHIAPPFAFGRAHSYAIPNFLLTRITAGARLCLGWPRRVQQVADVVGDGLSGEHQAASASAKVDAAVRFMNSYRETHPQLKLVVKVVG